MKPLHYFEDVERSSQRVVGYGYVGRFTNGIIGKILPEDLWGDSHYPEAPRETDRADVDEPAYLCRITIEVVGDKPSFPGTRNFPPRKVVDYDAEIARLTVALEKYRAAKNLALGNQVGAGKPEGIDGRDGRVGIDYKNDG